MSCPSVSSSSAPPKRERMRRAARATPRTLPYSREKNVTTRSLSPRAKLPMTTAGDLPRAMSGGEPESELAQRAIVLAPGVTHLHGEPQKDLDAEEGLQIPARRRADALEHGASSTDENSLLGVPLDEDGGPDIETGRLSPL